MEARNLRNMTIAQTPLLGEENTPIHALANGGTSFESATPWHQVTFTPNPLATPGATDGASATPLRTPMRDNLSINPEDRSFAAGTPREIRMRVDSTKRSLQSSFKSLPKPENNFELLVPDDEGEDDTESGKVLSEEDAAERDARTKRLKEEEERAALARRSPGCAAWTTSTSKCRAGASLQRSQPGSATRGRAGRPYSGSSTLSSPSS